MTWSEGSRSDFATGKGSKFPNFTTSEEWEAGGIFSELTLKKKQQKNKTEKKKPTPPQLITFGKCLRKQHHKFI